MKSSFHLLGAHHYPPAHRFRQNLCRTFLYRVRTIKSSIKPRHHAEYKGPCFRWKSLFPSSSSQQSAPSISFFAAGATNVAPARPGKTPSNPHGRSVSGGGAAMRPAPDAPAPKPAASAAAPMEPVFNPDAAKPSKESELLSPNRLRMSRPSTASSKQRKKRSALLTRRKLRPLLAAEPESSERHPAEPRSTA